MFSRLHDDRQFLALDKSILAPDEPGLTVDGRSTEPAIDRAPATVAETRPVDQPILGLVIVGVVAVLAFWPIWGDLFAWARADAPLGFAVIVVPVAALLAWRRYGNVLDASQEREPFLDGCIAVLALGAAILMLTRAPDWLGVWYWAERDDLLAVPLVMVALVAIVWGFDAVLAWGIPLVILVLLWPGIWLGVSGAIGPTLARLTAITTTHVLSWFGFGTVQLAAGEVVVVGAGASAFSLTISTACSGLSGVLGVLAVGGPIVFDSPGPVRTRVLLLFSAVVAALLGNVARVVALAAVIRSTGIAVASTLAHPLIGVLLFLLIVGGLAVVTPTLGKPIRKGRSTLTWGSTSSRGVLAVAAIAVLVAGLEWRLRWSFPEAGARIAPVSVTMLAPIGRASGWQIERFANLTWAEPLFGAGSQVALFRIRQPGQPDLWAQVVVTSDAGALAAHGVVDCDVLHGDKILASERRDIAPGLPAQAIIARDRFAHEFAELSWIQPVQVDERLLIRRIELIGYGGFGSSDPPSISRLVRIANEISTSQP